MNDEVKVSVNEFQNWLSGVLDFQPSDWVPDETQWNKILNKIKQLDDRPVSPTPVVDLGSTATVQSVVTGGPVTRNTRPIAPSAVLHSSPVELPDVPVRTKPKQVTVHRDGPPQLIGDGEDRVIATGQVHKTRVDLGDGQYESDFR